MQCALNLFPSTDSCQSCIFGPLTIPVSNQIDNWIYEWNFIKVSYELPIPTSLCLSNKISIVLRCSIILVFQKVWIKVHIDLSLVSHSKYDTSLLWCSCCLLVGPSFTALQCILYTVGVHQNERQLRAANSATSQHRSVVFLTCSVQVFFLW